MNDNKSLKFPLKAAHLHHIGLVGALDGAVTHHIRNAVGAVKWASMNRPDGVLTQKDRKEAIFFLNKALTSLSVYVLTKESEMVVDSNSVDRSQRKELTSLCEEGRFILKFLQQCKDWVLGFQRS